LADLEILRDDPGGTVTFHGNLEDDETYLYWYKINDLITHKLSGTWNRTLGTGPYFSAY